MLQLLEDPLLATAVSSSLKTGVQHVPSLQDDNVLVEYEQAYLDSKELAHRLRR